MARIDKAFYEVLTAGDKCSQPFTFPIPTVNITEDFNWIAKWQTFSLKIPPKWAQATFKTSSARNTLMTKNGNKIENEKRLQTRSRALYVLPLTA